MRNKKQLTPWGMGCDARIEGQPITACPYHGPSADAKEWRIGWWETHNENPDRGLLPGAEDTFYLNGPLPDRNIQLQHLVVRFMGEEDFD